MDPYNPILFEQSDIADRARQLLLNTTVDTEDAEQEGVIWETPPEGSTGRGRAVYREACEFLDKHGLARYFPANHLEAVEGKYELTVFGFAVADTLRQRKQTN